MKRYGSRRSDNDYGWRVALYGEKSSRGRAKQEAKEWDMITITEKRHCHTKDCLGDVEISACIGFPRRRRQLCAGCAFRLGEDVGVIAEGSAIRVAFPAQDGVAGRA